MLAACQQGKDDGPKSDTKQTTSAQGNSFAFAEGDGRLPPLPAGPETMPVQIALEGLGFSPGVIDGKVRESLGIAIMGFQAANALDENGARTFAGDRRDPARAYPGGICQPAILP